MHITLTGLFVSCTLTAISQPGIEIDTNIATTQPVNEQTYNQRVEGFGTRTKSLTDYFSSADDVTLTPHDSVYISRLYSLPTEVNLDFNPVISQYIEKYTKNVHNQVSDILGKSNYYFPLIEKILEKEGIPLELKYLAVSGSALDPMARSHADASGIWQFELEVGESYDLEVNSLVDERRDPVKSTMAAAKYLKDLYYVYDDWSLVLAAYNCGPVSVNKAIYSSGGQTDFWKIYPYLPKETRDYVPAYIAASYIMNYYSEHGIRPAESIFSVPMNSVEVSKNIRLQHVANVINVPLNDLRRYNPQFTTDLVPANGKEYTLNLPSQKVLAFLDNEDAIYSNKMPKKVNRTELLAQKIEEKKSAFAEGNSDSGANLREPELMTVSVDLSSCYEVIDNYLKQIEGEWVVLRSLENEGILDDLRLTAVTNNDDPKVSGDVSKKKGKNIFDHVAGFAGSAYRSVKDWGESQDAQLKEESSIENISDQIIEIQSNEVISSGEESTSETEKGVYSTIDSEEDLSSYTNVALNDNATKVYHKVKIGETITQIALHYKVSKDDIIKWNNLTFGVARISQRLLIYLPKNDDLADVPS